MLEQGIAGSYAEQAVQKAGVADKQLRSLHLPFADVLVPGLKQADHESRLEDVKVASDGGIRSAERAPEFRVIDQLAVVLRQHHPETGQRLRRNVDA
jgi:hypothetical protein